jgi:hypothetical protein
MAIYTGQSPVDMIDFNEIPNGSGNYHIINNKITIKQSILGDLVGFGSLNSKPVCRG